VARADHEDPTMQRIPAGISLIPLAISGCIPFHSFQTAHIVPPGEEQATVAVARTDYQVFSHDDPGWTFLDLRFRHSLAPRSDWAFGVIVARGEESEDPGAIIGADLRAALWRNHLTVVLPVCFILGDPDFATFQLQPGVVATLPLPRRFDVTAAARRHVFVRFPDVTIWSYNLSLGVPVPGEKAVLRPEAGWMYGGSGGPPYTMFGLGIVLSTE
jgi:hypothetical protein